MACDGVFGNRRAQLLPGTTAVAVGWANIADVARMAIPPRRTPSPMMG